MMNHVNLTKFLSTICLSIYCCYEQIIRLSLEENKLPHKRKRTDLENQLCSGRRMFRINTIFVQTNIKEIMQGNL